MKAAKADLIRVRRIRNLMISRCHNPRDVSFFKYGERGIAVCDEWQRSFAAFSSWALSHGYDDGLQIDRIDNDLGYCPENCRWVTPWQQQNNRRIRRQWPQGVRRHVSGLFEARLWINGKRITLGYRKTADEAAKLYRRAVKRRHGIDV